MSGFSTSRSGIDNVSKQYGSILRGGPPVPKAGVGDLYIDNMTFQLFEKRAPAGLMTGVTIFLVPYSLQKYFEMV
jgi:hypothetical protein